MTRNSLENQLIQFRRDLHTYPELSNQEFETTAKIRRALEEHGITICDLPLTTGLVAEIKGELPGSVIALRGDIDALPILEQSDVSFPSLREGVMHACGHDFHTSVMLGVAILLNEQKTTLPGTVRILFQPAEETGHGAKNILNTGILDDVTAIFGLHNDPTLKVGEFGTKTGALTAGVDRFEIHVKGVGAHAAKPHEGNDPILITGAIIGALQSIISRNVSSADNAVVSITQVHSGSTWNVIPEAAYLEGTVRTFSSETRAYIQKRMTQILHGIGESFDAEVTLTWHPGPPSVMNTAEWADLSLQIAAGHGYDAKTIPVTSVGEDFAFYQEKFPGAFVMIGSGGPYDLHHPKFKVDDTALYPACTYFVKLAFAALERLREQ
ncbi:amidohydrolase [Paenibacillus segetis]|uniref:Hydrolase n=1 Tax=Paenibacillus segetis TaxID=1325360 RepID=A0ABQ1Y543_9BACL|nr:amidohydrolase [Paenibacillus segetis]GGH12260.1 hydrolase [Paenibacillus segetis]